MMDMSGVRGQHAERDRVRREPDEPGVADVLRHVLGVLAHSRADGVETHGIDRADLYTKKLTKKIYLKKYILKFKK